MVAASVDHIGALTGKETFEPTCAVTAGLAFRRETRLKRYVLRTALQLFDECSAPLSLSLRWCIALFAGVALLCASERASSFNLEKTAHIDYQWPMDKYGNHWIVLRVSSAFAGMDVAAQAMNNTFNPPHAADEPVVKQILLYALWPDLSTDPSVIRHAIDAKDPRLILALMESGATASFNGKNYDRLQIAFDVAVDDSTNNICILPYEWSTQPHPMKVECLERKAPDIKPSEFGLKRIGVDFAKFSYIPNATRKGLHEDDLYYLRGPDGRLSTFIQCTAIERAPDNQPDADAAQLSCDHQFISPKTDSFVKLTYRRAYLKDWREMERRWNKLIDSFVATGERKED